MADPLAARLHAFLHGVTRPKETVETRALYDEVSCLFTKHGVNDAASRADLARRLGEEAASSLGVSPDHPQAATVASFVKEVFDYEGLFTLPRIDRIAKLSIGEHWTLRDMLTEQRRFAEEFEATTVAFASTLAACLAPLYETSPSLIGGDEPESGIPFKSDLIGSVPGVGGLIEDMIAAFFTETAKQTDLFARLRARLDRNLVAASGGNPEKPETFNRALKPPGASPIADPETLAETYLSGTPLRRLLDQRIPITLPDRSRFEHCHVLGGTGHGKTQLLQYMLHYDLGCAREERASVVVIDSQGDLIRKLSKLDVFDPTDPDSLADRFLLIDPSDIEHPPALNLFDPGLERLADYTPRERELAFNSLVDIYGRFFGALLGSELTAKQGAVFRYLARLMLTVEGATIHTLIELMDDVSPFEKHIEALDPTARRFFENEFSRGGFNATRQQIKQRLYAVLSIPTFDRLFSAPRSKVSFFNALNEGTIVLVNTAKDLLKADGTAIFGRFILALIEHAVMERANLPENERTPVFLYVDEAQDYFDETIETLLVQGRKFSVGLTLAHQTLAQLSPRLRAVLMSNTTIKFAGGVSDADARALASDMRTTPDNLLAMRKGDVVSSFALSVRNMTPNALTVDVPFGLLEDQPALNAERYEALLNVNRERIGYVPDVERDTTEEGSTGDVPASSERESETDAGSDHVAVQHRLAELARERGFGAEIEYALSDGKRIDLALFGHNLSIAVEISVTNREGYELSNVEKALAAGFDQVWLVADDPDHRERIASHVRRTLSPQQLIKVSFGTSNDAVMWLSRFDAPTGEVATVAGYTVGTIFVPPSSVADHEYRRERLRQVMNV